MNEMTIEYTKKFRPTDGGKYVVRMVQVTGPVLYREGRRFAVRGPDGKEYIGEVKSPTMPPRSLSMALKALRSARVEEQA